VRGRLGTQSVCNRFQHTLHIAHDIVVPEPQNAIVMLLQPSIAHAITFIVSMLPAIQLDNQSSFPTNKICNVGTDWLLPNKFVTIDRSRTNSIPKT
jgi:hypothetical protein